MSEEQPTPEELAKAQADAQQVSAAGAAAAIQAQQAGKTGEQAREDVDAAVKARAGEVGMPISDEDAGKIADTVIDKLREYGAFDPPTPTPPAPTPTPSPEQQAAHEAAAAAANPAPAKRTFAEKFAGI